MTIDMDATTTTIDALQLGEDYDEIRQIIQYAIAALVTDGEELGEIIPPMI